MTGLLLEVITLFHRLAIPTFLFELGDAGAHQKIVDSAKMVRK